VIVTLLAILAIIAAGGRASDSVRTSQIESILLRLPEGEARDYYALLRRRLRRVAVMRALALLSLLALFYVFRQRLVPAQPPAAPAPPVPAAPR
jgi:hypothetical protein